MPFSLKTVSQLEPYSPLERIHLLNLALKHLSAPEKAGFNLIKLLVIVPPFFGLARLEPWLAIIGLVGVLVGFSLLTRPLQIFFARNHWLTAVKEYEQQKKQCDED